MWIEIHYALPNGRATAAALMIRSLLLPVLTHQAFRSNFPATIIAIAIIMIRITP